MRVTKRSLSLVEAILTIAIIGILAGILLPHFVKRSFLNDLKLRSATSQIASDIRYARQLAITNNGHYLISFNCTAKEYKIYNNTNLPSNQIGETKKISSDVTCSGTSQFDFYDLGNCLFSGTGIKLSLGTQNSNISVETPTGAVLIE